MSDDSAHRPPAAIDDWDSLPLDPSSNDWDEPAQPPDAPGQPDDGGQLWPPLASDLGPVLGEKDHLAIGSIVPDEAPTRDLPDGSGQLAPATQAAPWQPGEPGPDPSGTGQDDGQGWSRPPGPDPSGTGQDDGHDGAPPQGPDPSGTGQDDGRGGARPPGPDPSGTGQD
ncbi:MAG: hypothetical protein LBP92_03005, partial [Deltaproteobacteria bacterium]|nr:hypothetical protein [Deltaproteobacteria bacterium]